MLLSSKYDNIMFRNHNTYDRHKNKKNKNLMVPLVLVAVL